MFFKRVLGMYGNLSVVGFQKLKKLLAGRLIIGFFMVSLSENTNLFYAR